MKPVALRVVDPGKSISLACPVDDGINPDSSRLEPSQTPIEIAYAKIRFGMGEKDVHRLMSPFNKAPGGDGQELCWTDGKVEVSVSLSSSAPQPPH